MVTYADIWCCVTIFWILKETLFSTFFTEHGANCKCPVPPSEERQMSSISKSFLSKIKHYYFVKRSCLFLRTWFDLFWKKRFHPIVIVVWSQKSTSFDGKFSGQHFHNLSYGHTTSRKIATNPWSLVGDIWFSLRNFWQTIPVL